MAKEETAEYYAEVSKKNIKLGDNLVEVLKTLRGLKDKTLNAVYIKVGDKRQEIEKDKNRLELIKELAEVTASPLIFKQMRTDLLKYFAISKLKGFIITAVFEDDGITGQTIIHPNDIEPADARQLYAGSINQTQMFGNTLVKQGTMEPIDQGRIIVPGDSKFTMQMQDIKV